MQTINIRRNKELIPLRMAAQWNCDTLCSQNKTMQLISDKHSCSFVFRFIAVSKHKPKPSNTGSVRVGVHSRSEISSPNETIKRSNSPSCPFTFRDFVKHETIKDIFDLHTCSFAFRNETSNPDPIRLVLHPGFNLRLECIRSLVVGSKRI